MEQSWHSYSASGSGAALVDHQPDSGMDVKLPLSVVLLTNMIAPYSLPVLQKLTASIRKLKVYISTSMEPNRPWRPNWNGVDVTVQRSFMIRRNIAYKQGYEMEVFKHFPYDSLVVLYKNRPDVVISTEMGVRTILAVIYRLLNSGSRLLIWADLSEHTEREVGYARNLLRKLLLLCTDAVLVNGASGSRYIYSLGVSQKRIISMPYTTDMGCFLAVPLARRDVEARRLLYVGQLVQRKGLDLFLPVFFEWATKRSPTKYEMWIVGDGPLRRRLERQRPPKNVTLKFIGNIPYKDLAKYYAQAGILVLPSLSDTWGLVVNEAMASGLAVLGSSYSQAVQELVKENINGWTFHIDHLDEVSDALDRALLTPSTALAQMRECARESVRYLTPEYGADQLLESIRVAINKNEESSGLTQ